MLPPEAITTVPLFSTSNCHVSAFILGTSAPVCSLPSLPVLKAMIAPSGSSPLLATANKPQCVRLASWPLQPPGLTTWRRDLLAYGQVILLLAKKHGDLGWVAYDNQFQQQATVDAPVQWLELNLSLMAATIFAVGG